MPTGYTAPLYEGVEISFAEFMLRCSRAFGATIMLRDHDGDVLPTPENVREGDYGERQIREHRAEIVRLKAMSEREVEAESEADYAAKRQRYETHIAENEARRGRYEAMIERVEAWTPPSEDHVPFKEFVLAQLRKSIDFDCRYVPDEPERQEPVDWLAAKLAEANRMVDYYAGQEAERDQRNETRIQWVRQLRESLEEGVPA